MTDPLERRFRRTIPDGDDRQRSVCDHCGFVDYENPRIIVGSVATDDRGRILMCRRAIEPSRGLWTLPAGFMEAGDTPQAGARREAREEALADLEILSLLAVYTVTRISQVQLLYRARLRTPEIAPGVESLEVGLFEWASIPWKELAFPTVGWALEHHRHSIDRHDLPPFTNP